VLQVLLKMVLSAMPIHGHSNKRVPNRVIMNLEKISMEFDGDHTIVAFYLVYLFILVIFSLTSVVMREVLERRPI